MTYLRPYRWRRGRRRKITVQVTDRERLNETHWLALRANYRARGFYVNDGFDRHAARRRARHTFWMNERLLRRFVNDVAPLVRARRLRVEIDGRSLAY